MSVQASDFTITLIERANKLGIKISCTDNQLIISFPKTEKIDPEFLEELKANKSYLLEYFEGQTLNLNTIGFSSPISVSQNDRPQKVPLSFSQERLWIIDQIGGSIHYHIPVVLRLEGDLNKLALAYSLSEIVNRHESLRTVIAQDENGLSYQHVLDSGKWSLGEVTTIGEDNFKLREKIAELTNNPFKLSQDHCLRADLININRHENLIVITLHHIAADAWSVPILVRELTELYSAYAENRPHQLKRLSIQYSDYSIWERTHLSGQLFSKKINYWKTQLDEVATLNLPTDYLRPAISSIEGDVITANVNKEIVSDLKLLSRKEGVTLYMTCLTAFQILLHRYSGQDDICIGSSVAGRKHEEIAGLIGFFANTLALRNTVKSETSFKELLRQVKQTTLDAFDNQEVPFEKVVEVLGVERSQSRNPVFQVMFVFEEAANSPQLKLGDIKLSGEPAGPIRSKFDLTLSISQFPMGLHISITYRADLYEAATIKRMAEHYEALLGSITNNPDSRIGDLDLLPLWERKRLLEEFNFRETNHQGHSTIVELFEEQAEKKPGSIALVFQEHELTYRELNERSNQLGHYLISKGVKADTPVPIFIERSLEMIIGILGIMKAGGAYVPIDQDYPEERIKYILSDIGADIIVTNGGLKFGLPRERELTLVDLELDNDSITQMSTKNVCSDTKFSDLAYIIYTSGSTGIPKGVMIEHRSLIDYIHGLAKNTIVTQCVSFALVSTIAADLGNTVIFSSLVSGGSLHILLTDVINDGKKFWGYLEYYEINCLKIVPSHWRALCEGNNPILPTKALIFGGEVLDVTIIENIKLLKYAGEIYNHYGPTETTIGKCICKIDLKKNYVTIPIGKPFSDTQIYIVDKYQALTPIGIVGELCIAGTGLARGYWDMPDLTEEKFIHNTYSKDLNSRLYRTGDYGRWLPDGSIEYSGRLDDQVKIRGYRIELKEIERTLLQSEHVRQCVVLNEKNANGDNYLVGYVVPAGKFSQAEIMDYLGSKLPKFMIPSLLVELEYIPLTPNGKINRAELSNTRATLQSFQRHDAPRNELEQEIANIWQDLLGVEGIGINDNFFKLGGHSLLAITAISLMRKKMNIDISIGDIFDFPTISGLVHQLSTQPSKKSWFGSFENPHEHAGEAFDFYPATHQQKKEYIRYLLIGKFAFNSGFDLQFYNLDKKILKKVIFEIIQRHECLRTTFFQTNGEIKQRINEIEFNTLKIKYVNLIDKENRDEMLSDIHKQSWNIPFDFENGSPVSFTIIDYPNRFSGLLVRIHHVVSDEVSKGILEKEIKALYESLKAGKGNTLPPSKIQFKDYALWVNKFSDSEKGEKSNRFYVEKIKESILINNVGDVLNNKLSVQQKSVKTISYTEELENEFKHFLKKDDISEVSAAFGLLGKFYPQPGASYTTFISEPLLIKLNEVSSTVGTSLFMSVVSSLSILLYKINKEPGVRMYIPYTTRVFEEFKELMGWLSSEIIVCLNIKDNFTFKELVNEASKIILETSDHRFYPCERILADLDMPLNVVAPFFVNYLKVDKRIENFNSYHDQSGPGLFNFKCTLKEHDNGILIHTSYNTEVYSRNRIEDIFDEYFRILDKVMSNPEISLSSL